jgi:hypothetical protein
VPLSDREAKDCLRTWPNTTRLWSAGAPDIWWLRAQPADGNTAAPRLHVPGAKAFQTQPDGLWVTFGIPRGEVATQAAYADCIAVESCGTSQNLNDKRARYAARTTSFMLNMRQTWLNTGVILPGRGGTPRRRRDVLQGQLAAQGIVSMPVRHLRVLYALPEDDAPTSLYARAREHMVLEAHEYVCPQRVLGQWNVPAMQRFLKRMPPDLLYYE